MDKSKLYANQKCFIIPNGSTYLLGILNSKVFFFLFQQILPKLRGDFYEPSYVYLKDFPIVRAKDSKPISRKVNQILAAKKKNPEADIAALEAEIDQMVYKLYDLTAEEITIVEGAVG